MQDQEGFDNTENVELVEFTYKPVHILSEIKRKPTAKAQEGWQLTRDASRGQWAASIISKEPQNVVFSPSINIVSVPENQLQFQADFQSSNLELVIRKRFLEYELYLRPDTNTETHFQWFNFRVKCLKNPKKATFTIKNFIKAGMLYTSGLRPFVRTNKFERYQQLEGEVHFFENVPEESFCLKFSYTFIAEGEEVEFSSQPPYSYSTLMNTLTQMNLDYKVLCKSMMGRRVPYLTFYQQKAPKALAIVIARQHPGQSVGSWMMEGLLRKLSNSIDCGVQWLIVPMMCVDGVILGNNRTGLAGYDYNRFWNTDELNRKEKSFPQIVALVSHLKQLRKLHPKKPKIFLDLHGHSSQPNIFTYGPPHEPNSDFHLISRVFPELLARKNDNFNLEQCSYMITPDKRNTSRSLLFYQFMIPFVYTVEASFGIMRNKKVNENQFLQFGEDLVEVVHCFLCNNVLGEKPAETAVLIEEIKARGDQVEAVEYDSDNQQQPKSIQKRSLAATDRGCKNRFQNESPPNITRKDSEQINMQLFRVEQSNSTQHRYLKPKQRQRVQTEIGLSKSNKLNFLPRLKQTSKKLITQGPVKQECQSSLMNIKDIHKRLYRLRNSRIGKKILIINSYGM